MIVPVKVIEKEKTYIKNGLFLFDFISKSINSIVCEEYVGKNVVDDF